MDISTLPTVQKVITQASLDIYNMTGLNVRVVVQVMQDGADSEAYGNLIRLRNLVSSYFKMPFEIIAMKSRKKSIVDARHVYIFIAHKVLGLSHTAIADEFGQDRTAIIHAVNKIDGFIKVNDPAADDAFKVFELFTNSKLKP